MDNDRKLDSFDDLRKREEGREPYHSNEWGGALSSEPLSARSERSEIVGGVPPATSRTSDYSTGSQKSSMKEKLHSVTEKAHEKLDTMKERVRPVVNEKIDAVRTPVQHKIAELRPVVDHRVSTVKQSGRDAITKGKSFLRENPAILPAVTTGIGLIAGMIARRALRRRKPLGVVIVEPRHGATSTAW